MVEEQLRNVFRSGVTYEVVHRKNILLKLKEYIIKRESEIFSALRADLGKCQFEAKITETGFVIAEINHQLRNLDDWSKDIIGMPPVLGQPARTRLTACPKGVVLILAPWNYPFQLAMAPLVGAIAAGNCVALKPSELAPETAKIIWSLTQDVFTDKQVHCVLGGKDVAESLLKQPFNHFFFTGSRTVGRIVAHAALEHFASFTLELGGKSPCIVDDTAHALHSARRIAWGKSLNAGQTCVAPDYLLVKRSIHDKLLHSIVKEWQSFYGEDPAQSQDYGKIVNNSHFDRLEKILESTNGRVIGGRRDRNSRFFEPTIVTNINIDDPVMRDEIFGPILPVLTWDDENELDSLLRKNPDPLAFYVFTERKIFSDRLLRQYSFGGGCVNHIALHLGCPDLPFGGVGTSGIGNYHGRFGFETFSHYKSIVEASSLFDVRLKYPPYGKVDNLLKWFYL